MAGYFGLMKYTQDFQDQQIQLLKEQRKKQNPAASRLIGRATRVRQTSQAKIHEGLEELPERRPLLGCATGFLFLLVGGSTAWKLPLAMSATVLLSSYVIRVKEMWRQAPITAALVIAAGLTHHSKLSGVEIGLRRMSEVMLGCVMGLLVTWLISKIWPPQEARKEQGATKPSSP